MDITDLKARLETALASDAPRIQLQLLMGEVLENGLERSDVVAALQTVRARLVQAGRADEADLIDEIADGFDGWCIIH